MSKRTVIKTIQWGLGAVALLIVLAAAAFTALQTPWGRARLIAAVEAASRVDGAPSVRIEGLTGVVPLDFSVGAIALYDREGLWIRIEELDFRLGSLWALFAGRLHVEHCRAGEVRLLRAPVAEADAASEEEGSPLSAVRNVFARLAVGEMRVERLTLEEPVLGEPAAFMFDGALGEASADRGQGVRLRVDGGPAARLEGDAVLWLDADRLRVAFVFQEAPGGIVGRALSIPDGVIEVRMEGDGALDAWKGRCSAAVGPWGTAVLGLGLEIGDALRLSIDGMLRPAEGALPPEWSVWCSKAPEVAVVVRMDDPETATVERVAFDTGGVRLEGSGSFDFERRLVEAGFETHIPDLAPLGTLTGGSVKGTLTLSGSAKGPFDRISAEFHPVLESVQISDVGFKRLVGTLQAEFASGRDETPGELRWAGEGSVDALEVAGRRPLGDLPLVWKIALAGPNPEGWGLESLELAAEGQRLTLAGSFDPAGPRGELQGVFSSTDLSRLAAPWGVAVAGRTDLRFHVAADGPGDLDAAFEGTLSVPAGGLPPGILPALEGRWVAAGACRLEAGRHLTFEEVRLEGERETLGASGTLDLTSRRIEWSASLYSADIAAIGRNVGLPVEGAVAASAVASGTLGAPEITIEAAGTEFRAAGIAFPGLRLKGSLRGPFAAARGEAVVSFGDETERYAVAGLYAFEGERISIDDIRVTAPGLTAEGRLHLAGGAVEGELAGTALDLSFLAPFLGWEMQDLGGAADFRFTFDPSPEGGTLTCKVSGSGIRGRFGRIDSLDVSGSLRGPLDRPAGKARMEVKGFRQAPFSVASLSVSLEGEPAAASFEAQFAGTYGEPVTLDLDGAFSYGAEAEWLRIERLQGRYGAYPVSLIRPVTVERESAAIDMADLALRFGSGELRASLHVDGDRLRGDGTVVGWPLESLPLLHSANATGLVNVSLQVAGSPEKPVFEADFGLKDVMSTDPDFSGMPPVQVAGRAKGAEGGLSVSAGMHARDREIVSFDCLAPYSVSFSPAGAQSIDGQEWSGRLRTDIDLAMVNALMDWEDQVLSGVLKADMSLEGGGEAPILAGGLKVAEGAYENLRTGTVLKEIDLEASCNAERIEITSARASDGGNGRLSAAGWMALAPAKGFPLHLDLTLANATLVRRVDATVAAEGALRLTGTLRDMLLGGRVVVGPAELRIPEKLPPEVVILDVIEVNGAQGGPAAPEKKEIAAEPSSLRLRFDLAVSSPGRVFVRGRGLESEWQGDLTIEGSADAPVVAGRLSLVRGRFNFLGKPFLLTRGVITFDGSVPPEPYIDVVADASTGDVTARVSLAGTPSTLELALTSDPPLPPDEILSYILFRRTASRLNAAQALQLANAIRTLAGGGGLDFMSRTRRFLNVDQLQIKTPEDGRSDTALAAGKYIHEKVYLEMERGLGPESGRITVDIEITPSITWEADVGENSEGGIGIKWRRDY